MSPTLVARDRTALLVIDMQNAFCHPDGSFATMAVERGLSIDLCRAVIAPCADLVAAATAAAVPVILTRYLYHRGYIDGGILVQKYPGIRDLGALAPDSWDGELVDELKDLDGSIVIDKSRYSAFYGTRLQPVLTSLKIESLMVCGVTTNVCVESTVRDAAQFDYRTCVVTDATAELNPERHRNALEIMEYGFADLTTVAAVQQSWSQPPP
jgi:ureidoacrylate peracid hydrolase